MQGVSIKHIIFFSLLVFVNVYSFPIFFRIGMDVLLALYVMMLGTLRKHPRIKTNTIWTISLFLLVYTVFISITATKLDYNVLFKPARFLFVLVVFNIITQRLHSFTLKEICISLFLVFLLHVLCVYIEFLIPSTRDLIYSFLEDFQTDEEDVRLRAKGLCSSYDEAGLVLCVIQSYIYCLFRYRRSKLLFLALLVSIVASLLVSRTTMLVSAVFAVIMMLSFLKHERGFFFLFIVPVLAIVAYYVYGLVELYLAAENLEESYYSGSAEILTTDRMLFLPDTAFGIIFGTGKNPVTSDIGYIKIIHMIGFFGLFVVLFLYYYTFKIIKKVKEIDYNVFLFLFLFLSLLIIFNYKLLMLYARGINDLYFLLLFMIINNKHILYANNKVSRVL